MADENPTTPEVNPEDEALRAEGIRALKAERESNKALKAQLAELAKWKEDQENAGKSDLERLNAELSSIKAAREKDAREALRLRVAMEKGLTAKQAARLVGDDEEALLADADDLLSSFKPTAPVEEDDAPETGLNNRPQERLKGGARPTDTGLELDPAKLAAGIPRNGSL